LSWLSTFDAAPFRVLGKWVSWWFGKERDSTMARQPARTKAGKKAPPKSYKAALTMLNIDAWRQLKHLSADKDKPVSELQCEAINLLFAKHGLPQIAVRWTAEN
jgi:hypothetical protein